MRVCTLGQCYRCTKPVKELDEREELRPDYFTELRRTADLSLRTSKETVRATDRSMAALMAVGETSMVDPI